MPDDELFTPIRGVPIDAPWKVAADDLATRIERERIARQESTDEIREELNRVHVRLATFGGEDGKGGVIAGLATAINDIKADTTAARKSASATLKWVLAEALGVIVVVILGWMYMRDRVTTLELRQESAKENIDKIDAALDRFDARIDRAIDKLDDAPRSPSP